MLCVSFLILLLFFTSSEAAPTAANCPSTLKAGGASELFGVHVGHAVHSMTVEALKLFEPSVTVNNKVPTANMHAASSEDVLLFHAPESSFKASDDFKTSGMRVLDKVLLSMDKSIPHSQETTLEKLVHEMHMEELWANMLPHYQKIKANPPANVDAFCSCAMDMENNGIFQTLRIAAIRKREPGLMVFPIEHQNEQKNQSKSCPLRYNILYKFTSYGLKLAEFEKADASSNEICGSMAWVKFVDHLKSVNHLYDASLFLYCALNHA